MALSIKDEQTDRVVRRYARLHGISYTKAIAKAVTEALDREGAPIDEDEEDFATFIAKLQAEVRKHPILDSRDHAEMLYDEDGLPK